MITHVLMVFFTAIYAVVCVLLVLIILMQRSKQDGIGATFGSGITESMFGAQTSSVLVKATSWLVALFFGLSILLAQFSSKSSSGISPIQQQIKAAATPPPVPVANPASATIPGGVPPKATQPVPTAQPTVDKTSAPVQPAAAPAPPK